ncbi:Equilibrative nucleoside transporter [Globisporangium polare]
MASTSAAQKRAELALDLELITKQQQEREEREQQQQEETAHALTSPEWSVGFFVTYGAFFFAGASAISMWSCITLCLDFFAQKYPSERVGFVFPVVNMSTLLVISLYMVLAGRQLPLGQRMNGSLACYLVCVLLLPLVNIVQMPNMIAYTLTLLALVSSTISSSVMQASVYGLGGVFGPFFIQAIEGGKGFGAILLFAIRLGLKRYFELPAASIDGDAQQQAERASLELYYAKLSMAVFFGVAFAVVALTWVLYTLVKHTKFAESMLEEYMMVQNETPFNATQLLSPLSSSSTTPHGSVIQPQFPEMTERSPLLNNADPEVLTAPNEDDDDEALVLMREHASSATLLTVARVAAKPLFSLFLSFFVCLSCFPGIISAIQSTTFGLADWYPIVLVGCYNLGDLVGKNLPMYIMYFDVQTLHLPWLLQISFIPFFILALVHPFADIITISAVVLLGLVTGYVATSSLILAPSVCSEYQKEVAGMIGGLSAIVGLCLGSYNGLALETLIQLWTQS